MTRPTLLHEDDLATLESITVEGQAYRHLFRARRLATGEAVRVVDGRGRARAARIGTVTRSDATVILGEVAASLEPIFELELLVAAPKLERAATLVEKATELGVGSIRFFKSERSPREYSDRNLERLRRVATAALLQCGRSRLPELDGVFAWESVESMVTSRGSRWVLSPGGQAFPRVQAGSDGVVVVGPEGGFSELEISRLKDFGCREIDLGPRILRVETAALAAAALCLLPR